MSTGKASELTDVSSICAEKNKISPANVYGWADNVNVNTSAHKTCLRKMTFWKFVNFT